MITSGTRHGRSALRQEQIINAALACFTERGFTQTTMGDIQRTSRSSNGSIYHFFKGKEQIAAAVYLSGISDYQSGLLAEMERHKNARKGLGAIIHFHLGWVAAHPDWARFLFRTRHAGFMAASEGAMAAQNREFGERLSRWFGEQMQKGKIRRLSLDLCISILLGPCQEFTRLWLAGTAKTPMAAAKKTLAEAAQKALCLQDKDSPGRTARKKEAS